MGIIDPKNTNAPLRPKQDDAFHFRPELRPVFATEVQRINVFVFLRRILRVLNRAVRPSVKPLWVLYHVGMVGRAIDRKIECDFHSALAHLLFQPIKIFECTQRWIDVFVAAAVG